MRPLVSLSVLLLTSLVPSQGRVWIVDQHGGAQFTEVQPAIDAASAGDRIVVRSVAAYAAFMLTKGLEIEAVSGASVYSCSVQDLRAGEQARVSGFTVWPPLTGSQYGRTCLTVQRCAGSLRLATLVVGIPNSGTGIDVTDSGAVLLEDCTVRGGDAYGSPFGIDGWPAVTIQRSRVALQWCRLQGGAGSYYSHASPYTARGGDGLAVAAASVFVAGSDCAGGPGGAVAAQFLDCRTPGMGGNGCQTDGDTLLAAGCLLLAGPGGRHHVPQCPTGPSGDAVVATQAGARVTADCLIQGRLLNVAVIRALPWLRAPVVAMRSALTNVVAYGPPGTALFLFLSPSHTHVPLPGIEGPLLVAPPVAHVATVNVTPSGWVPWSFVVPFDPWLADQLVFLQGIAIEPGTGMLSLTNAAGIRIR